MTYKLAYSTNAYTQWSLLDAIADIRRLGFDGVEILADTPHAFPPLKEAEVARLRKAVRGFGISNLNGNTVHDAFDPSLIAADASARRARVAYTKRTIDLARALGAENVCTCTGRLPKGVTAAAAGKHLAKSLEAILAYAEKKPQVRVGIEAEPGFFVGDTEALLAVLKSVDHPLLGANLDLGHAWCSKEDLGETIEAVGARIWNIHIEDIRKRVHEHLVPGLGDIDFAGIRRALDEIGYARYVTLEIYPYKANPSEAGSQALTHLRRFFGPALTTAGAWA